MDSTVRLYLSYLKTAAAVMSWTALTFATYAFIRTSSVAGVVVAGLVSLTVSFAVALVVIQYFSLAHGLRRTLAAMLESVVSLLRADPRSHRHRA
ncbi:MAG: hypothetical protein A3K13_01260 [Gemmatimonadetes bacterium RIFCSPLOWO2_12_FULL_68_9]|nr:MAG: hypothetical protein A3K13_01260 [Gemmatimonadetes bacterium RIFCSPLOWO2_12_FULL_68_9]